MYILYILIKWRAGSRTSFEYDNEGKPLKPHSKGITGSPKDNSIMQFVLKNDESIVRNERGSGLGSLRLRVTVYHKIGTTRGELSI